MPAASEIFAPGVLDGRVVLVTGGGTNLGKRAAGELHAAGAHVVIAGRREEVLAEAAPEIGTRCSIVTGDVRDPASAAAIVDTVIERHGRLDALVNSAGGQYLVPAEELALKGWQAVWRLNVEGTRTMTTATVERGFGADGGVVVNVTVSPHHGYPAMAHTGAARAAVETMTREHAHAYAPLGIAVVAAAIGRFDTESLRKYPQIFYEGAAASIPLQRLGTEDEFAWLVTLLVSPVGRELSGSVVTLDGALDNYEGAWPRAAHLDDSGVVPTEERRSP